MTEKLAKVSEFLENLEAVTTDKATAKKNPGVHDQGKVMDTSDTPSTSS